MMGQMNFYGNLYDPYDTKLSGKDELAFQLAKQATRFKNDPGADYDYRGFYQKYNTLTPTATNGHLTDEFKKPYHNTFSNESRYYKGEPWAVNWEDENQPYKWAGQMGLL